MDSRTGSSAAICVARPQVPVRQPLYIFFTLWGLLFLLAGTLMFSFALLRLNEDLLFFAAFAAGLLLFVILMTHENLVGVTLSGAKATIDSTSGTLLLGIQLSNTSKSKRRSCHVVLYLAGKEKISLGPVDIPGKNHVTLSHRFEQGMPRYLAIRRAKVFSRYPFGFLTCWITVKSTPQWPLWLPPAPQRTSMAASRPHRTASASNEPQSEKPRSTRSSAHEGEISLKLYTNGPAYRIDWRRYLSTGEVLTRSIEALPVAADSSILNLIWDAAADTTRLHYAQIYSSVLEALRTQRPFTICNPQGAVLAQWDGLKDTSGPTLRSFLELGPLK